MPYLSSLYISYFFLCANVFSPQKWQLPVFLWRNPMLIILIAQIYTHTFNNVSCCERVMCQFWENHEYNDIIKVARFYFFFQRNMSHLNSIICCAAWCILLFHLIFHDEWVDKNKPYEFPLFRQSLKQHFIQPFLLVIRLWILKKTRRALEKMFTFYLRSTFKLKMFQEIQI